MNSGKVKPWPYALAQLLAVKAKEADFFLRPPTLKASNLGALLSKDLEVLVSTDLNVLKKYTKNQEASYNPRLGIALSDRLHLQRAFLVTVCRVLITTVFYFKCRIQKFGRLIYEMLNFRTLISKHSYSFYFAKCETLILF